ncbi:MAG: glycosyltransferase, partial [Candidatus Cloacimonadaceae bacterium]|nr:glycosyltransferase [Candidatus Cloacimonadaceae bacterium]
GDADPEYQKHCMDLIDSYQLTEHFRFMGKTDSVPKVLEDYDVLLMPTLAEEAFGRVIIEAMAMSMIVVATDAYGPREIIEHETDGFLFERGNANALAGTITMLESMDDSELQAVAQAARKKVETKYEISLVKKRIEIIIENVVQNNLNTQK